MLRRRIWIFILTAVILLALVLTGTNFYLDLLWFKDLAVESVFWTQILARWGLRLAAWLFLFIFIFFHLLVTRRYILSFPNLAIRDSWRRAICAFYPRRLAVFFGGSRSDFYMLPVTPLATGWSCYSYSTLPRLTSPTPSSGPMFPLRVQAALFAFPLRIPDAGLRTTLLVGIIYVLLNLPCSGAGAGRCRPVAG